jgi:hypothetical protein
VSKLGGDHKERTYKSVLFEIMPEAIAAERSASGRIDLRGLFYACRRLYLAHPERPRGREARLASSKKNPEHILEYGYFGNRIIPDYEAERDEIEGLLREPRGHLHEAHTMDDTHEIGTEFVAEFVAEFEPPDYYYDKVLFVEKHGIAEGLVDQRLGRKYDMAILASKGYGTVANRDLLEKFAEEGYEVYVLHDCDVDGYGILANLQEGNSRAAGLDGTAVDLGLSLQDARLLGLLGEEATRQKALPASFVTYLTHEELDLFTGTPRNAKVWDYTRFELNEIPAHERLPFVERKLKEAGVGPKVIPPGLDLSRTTAFYRDHDLDNHIRDAVTQVVGDRVAELLRPRFRSGYDTRNPRGWVEDRFSNGGSRVSWRDVVWGEIRDQGITLEPEIEAEVRRIVRIEDE